MSDKNIKYSKPLICGLHAATVAASEYNNHGECNCIGCKGLRCHDCSVYVEKAQARSMLPITEKSICDKCLMYAVQRGR